MIAVLALFGSCVTIVVLVLAAVTGVQVIRGRLPVRMGWVALGTAVVVTGVTLASAAILWLTRPPEALFQRESWSAGGAATPTAFAVPVLAATEVVPPAASPTPQATAAAAPTETAGATVAAATDAPTTTPGPTPAACPGAPPQRLRIGATARVCTARDRLVVRSQPRKDAPEIARLDPGIRLQVIDGPRCADDWSWWYVEFASGARGWVAEGGDAVDPYFVCP